MNRKVQMRILGIALLAIGIALVPACKKDADRNDSRRLLDPIEADKSTIVLILLGRRWQIRTLKATPRPKRATACAR